MFCAALTEAKLSVKALSAVLNNECTEVTETSVACRGTGAGSDVSYLCQLSDNEITCKGEISNEEQSASLSATCSEGQEQNTMECRMDVGPVHATYTCQTSKNSISCDISVGVPNIHGIIGQPAVITRNFSYYCRLAEQDNAYTCEKSFA
uniref:Uncharacterized protein n=1 Tax=Ditylenchus dipsaci TaxID=166011 RepID=A0A915DL60_9BILA